MARHEDQGVTKKPSKIAIKRSNFDSTYNKAHKTRAKALGESGNWEQAVKRYEGLAEPNPEEPDIQPQHSEVGHPRASNQM